MLSRVARKADPTGTIDGRLCHDLLRRFDTVAAAPPTGDGRRRGRRRSRARQGGPAGWKIRQSCATIVFAPGLPPTLRSREKAIFVAVYWWRVHPGKEDQFRRAWRRGTKLITAIYGSYGSRLHRDRDGRFVGYAEWPDEATWRAAFDRKMVYDEPETRAAFVDAIAETPAESDPIFTMTVVDDLLLRSDGSTPNPERPQRT